MTQLPIDPRVQGKKFVLTNVEDEKLEDSILDHGGIIVNKVDSTVTCVICGNLQLVTEKQMDAHLLGIPIYTISEWSGGAITPTLST